MPRAAGRARPEWDYTLIGAVVALAALGLVMVHSASVDFATRTYGRSFHFLLLHALYLAAGLALIGLVLRTRVAWWEALGPYLLMFGLLLLVAVLIPGVGVSVNGSTRWLDLGPFTLQPAELMKLFMVVYVAGYLVRKHEALGRFRSEERRVGYVSDMPRT